MSHISIQFKQYVIFGIAYTNFKFKTVDTYNRSLKVMHKHYTFIPSRRRVPNTSEITFERNIRITFCISKISAFQNKLKTRLLII